MFSNAIPARIARANWSAKYALFISDHATEFNPLIATGQQEGFSRESTSETVVVTLVKAVRIAISDIAHDVFMVEHVCHRRLLNRDEREYLDDFIAIIQQYGDRLLGQAICDTYRNRAERILFIQAHLGE